MGSDLVLKLDKHQMGPDAVVCPRDADHGKMGVHVSGSMLICGKCEMKVGAPVVE